MRAPPRFLLHPHRLHFAWWYGLAAMLVAVDYGVGPYVQFAATFILPVMLTAWSSGLRASLALAILLPLVRLTLMLTVWGAPWDAQAIVGTAAVRIVVFAFAAIVISRLADHERDLAREVEILEGILPICMHCKAIRNDSGQWETLERYIMHRTEASFSHGLCEPCRAKHYPEFPSKTGQ